MKARCSLQLMALLFILSIGDVQAQRNCSKPVLSIMSNDQLVLDIEAVPAKGKESVLSPKIKLLLMNAKDCPQRHSYSFSKVELIMARETMRIATIQSHSAELDLTGWENMDTGKLDASFGNRIVFTFVGLYDNDTKEKINEKFSYIWLIK